MSTPLSYAPPRARSGTASAYGDLAVATLPRERYPEAALSAVLHYIGRARRAMTRADVMTAHEALIAAQQILGMLRGALDFQAGGDLARRLESVYTFVAGELGRANLDKDPERLDPLPAVIEPLREAFARAAASQLAGQPAVAGAGRDRR